MYVDMDELKAEGDRMVGDDIAEEGIKYLQTINFTDRSGAAARGGVVGARIGWVMLRGPASRGTSA